MVARVPALATALPDAVHILHRARQRLAAGQLCIGAGLYLSRTSHVAGLFADIGYDWLFLDMEHNAMDLETAAQITMASLAVGISPIARVPPGQYALATRLLDAGALGIVMPHVDTAEEARELVRQLRYPPAGGRSCGYASPHFGFRAVPVKEAMAAQNDAVLVIAMIETQAALDNLEAISAVDGIDVLLIGTLDLSIDLGIAGQMSHRLIDDAYARVAAACAKHGKVGGMAGVFTEEQTRRYVDQGFRFILAGGDLTMLAAGATQRLLDFRQEP